MTDQNPPHPLLNRLFMLDRVTDERFQDHARRSSAAAARISTAVAFGLLEYHLLVEHRIPWDLITLVYVIGITNIAFMLWYRFKN
jgi:hypothetical protein